jgi:hypothetical protein
MNKNNAFKFFNEKIAAEEKIKPLVGAQASCLPAR